MSLQERKVAFDDVHSLYGVGDEDDENDVLVESEATSIQDIDIAEYDTEMQTRTENPTEYVLKNHTVERVYVDPNMVFNVFNHRLSSSGPRDNAVSHTAGEAGEPCCMS
jgi:hypothetical protein